MTIRTENETEKKFEFDLDKLVAELMVACLNYLNCPYEVECGVLVTDDARMKELNRRFRHMDDSTDVLSFPMVPFDAPCGFDALHKETTCFSPESGELLLGDVVISYDKAVSQAKEYGHSIKREVAFLIVHSVLHLFGYDHMDGEEAKNMERVQEDILDGLGIRR